jgi:predicted acylesterase/phospholipase RssA
MIKNLVISGGAAKSVSVLGCLKYLHKKKLLQSVDCIVGTSAGAIIAFFLALGYNPDKIIDTIKYRFIRDGHYKITCDELVSLNTLQSYGLDSGANIACFLKAILVETLHCEDITFIDLVKQKGINLVVCVANLTKQRTEYMCVDNTPQMSVLTALRMSISIPVLFTPVLYNDNLYVDGGLYEILPVGYIKNPDHDGDVVDTLAIKTVMPVHKQTNNFGAYMLSILDSMLCRANQHSHKNKRIKVVEIEFDNVPLLDVNFETIGFELNDTIVDASVDKGYETIRKYFGSRSQQSHP